MDIYSCTWTFAQLYGYPCLEGKGAKKNDTVMLFLPVTQHLLLLSSEHLVAFILSKNQPGNKEEEGNKTELDSPHQEVPRG